MTWRNAIMNNNALVKASLWGLLGLIPGNLIFWELKFFKTYFSELTGRLLIYYWCLELWTFIKIWCFNYWRCNSKLYQYCIVLYCFVYNYQSAAKPLCYHPIYPRPLSHHGWISLFFTFFVKWEQKLIINPLKITCFLKSM